MDDLIFECKSSMDKGTKRKTLFVIGVFIGITIFFLIISGKVDNDLLIRLNLGLIALYLSILSYGILNTPYSYRLSDKFLIINRRRSPLRIPLSDIQKVRVFTEDDRKGLVKVFAAEGVIGNFGRYSTKMHKKLHVLTSRDSNWTLLRMKTGKKYIISPDNLELIQKINERLG